MSSKKEVLEEWFQKVWAEEDKAAIYEMFVPDDSGARGLKKEEVLGPNEYAVFHQALLALVSDVIITIDSYIEQGDDIWAECTFTSKNRKSREGEIISIKGCVIGKIIDEKIVEASNHFDFLHLFEGLGLLPENAFESCMAGNKVEGLVRDS